MKGINKILLLVDQHQPEQALLAKLESLAKRYGAVVELYESCYSRSLVSSYLFDKDAAERAKQGYLHGEEKRLQQLADRLQQCGVEATTDVSWQADAEQGALIKIERFQPDLVVKSCSYHHRLSEYLFGHLDWQLIRHCPVPLLLVRERPWKATPAVVVALDPFHEQQLAKLRDEEQQLRLDDKVLRSGESLVTHLGGLLHLFHSYHTLPTSVVFDDTLMLNYEELRSRLSVLHRQAMAKLLDQHGMAQWEPSVHMAQGEAHKELPNYAQQVDADLVVLGGIERSTTDRLFVSSVTEKVLDHLQADVLVVKPD